MLDGIDSCRTDWAAAVVVAFAFGAVLAAAALVGDFDFDFCTRNEEEQRVL